MDLLALILVNTGIYVCPGSIESQNIHLLLFKHIFSLRRNAIFANFPFQIIASILMIITLYIYYGHDTVEYDKEEDVSRVKKNKDLAISLLYISRFLSGFSAGLFPVFFYLKDSISSLLNRSCYFLYI